MNPKFQPRRGQLCLLSRDEDDVLLLDEDTKVVGKAGVAGAREAIRNAQRRNANAREKQK